MMPQPYLPDTDYEKVADLLRQGAAVCQERGYFRFQMVHDSGQLLHASDEAFAMASVVANLGLICDGHTRLISGFEHALSPTIIILF